MNISIVTPVYNDWESLTQLSNEIINLSLKDKINIEKIIVVNDASEIEPPEIILNNHLISIVNLSTNLGHQRSIAIGLCYCNNILRNTDFVIVMDCDGEDQPRDIGTMLECAINNESNIIFAKRDKRSESTLFKLNYFIYKRIFKLLTMSEINFGNFSVVPFDKLKNIISNPDIWNHYSSSIIKSKLKYNTISTNRGKRYYGKSKMNFTNLVIHGLSSISIFIETIVVRLLMLNIIAALVSLTILIIILAIKLFSDYIIPGWNPLYTFGIFNILLLTLFFMFILVLMLLSNRSNVKKMPNEFYENFIIH